jgi:pyridoxal phosphate enzyme (YggS family)
MMIPERVAAVRDRITRAAARAARRPEEVTLVAVSKTFPAEAVLAAFEAGCRDFGENRVQEAEAKLGPLDALRAQGARWHLVGHLQANKARRAVQLFDRIHSIDAEDLGERLARIGAELSHAVHALIEVDLAGEATKHGLPAGRLRPVLEALRGLPGLCLEGLMVMPPYEQDAERTRPYFRRLRELGDELAEAGLLAGRELSMGMSHDLEVAVEEGATLVRVGTAIFGERG